MRVPRNIDRYICLQAMRPKTEFEYLNLRNEFVAGKEIKNAIQEIPKLKDSSGNRPDYNIKIRFKVFHNTNSTTQGIGKCVYDSGLITKKQIQGTLDDIIKENKHNLKGGIIERTNHQGKKENTIVITCKPIVAGESTINAIIKYTNSV